MYLIMQLLVDFVYTFRNFVNVYQQKNETMPFTRVIVSPLYANAYFYAQFIFRMRFNDFQCIITLLRDLSEVL